MLTRPLYSPSHPLLCVLLVPAMICEKDTLLLHLLQGKQLAEQLRLTQNDPSSSRETALVLEKILLNYQDALSILTSESDSLGPPLMAAERTTIAEKEAVHNQSSKRRQGKCEHVTVSYSAGSVPREDGRSWRKYGQKNILGSRFPRGYYRCTHRSSQGCLALKHVQRSDKDPMIIEVTYIGSHTCSSSVEHQENSYPVEQVIVQSALNSLQVQKKNAETCSSSITVPNLSNFNSTQTERDSIFQDTSSDFLSPASSESKFMPSTPWDIGSFGFYQSLSSNNWGFLDTDSGYPVPGSNYQDADHFVMTDYHQIDESEVNWISEAY